MTASIICLATIVAFSLLPALRTAKRFDIYFLGQYDLLLHDESIFSTYVARDSELVFDSVNLLSTLTPRISSQVSKIWRRLQWNPLLGGGFPSPYAARPAIFPRMDGSQQLCAQVSPHIPNEGSVPWSQNLQGNLCHFWSFNAI